MSDKKWVQHISGIGEKFEVDVYHDQSTCGLSDWRVWGKVKPEFHYLPKSEYRLCEPPERWEKCEVAIVPLGYFKGVGVGERVMCGDDVLAELKCGGKYRIHTLIVEKKVLE